MKDDAALLQSYTAEGSQEAFAELVRRHLSLVYHAALRQTGGDPHRAEEVAQLVFTELARKAATLSRHPLLVAWLHTSTRNISSQLRRTEQRRQAREQAAFAMNADDIAFAPAPAADWDRLRPFIDDALQTLGERDRAAVLLRFFENRSYAELAIALSVTDDAARVRVNRALEKLRATLARRGLGSTASALGLALAQPALAATPAGLAASITTASLSAASATAVGASAGFAAATFMSTVKIAAATAGALTLLSVGVALYQRPPASAKIAAPPALALSAADLATILRPARLAPDEADAALAAYLALPPLATDAPEAEILARLDRLDALLTVLPNPQVARLMAALVHREGAAEVRLRRAAFDVWTERDAPVAARWALAIVPGAAIDAKTRSLYLTQAGLAWAREDFAAAYAWAGALGDAAARRDLLAPLLGLLAATDPQQALALAKNGDEAFVRDAERAVLTGWAKHDPATALRSLGPGLLQQPDPLYDLLGSICNALEQWTVRDPAAALDWAVAQPVPDGDPSRSVLGFAWAFALHHPETVRPFLDALALRDDVPDRARVLQKIFGPWVREDCSAALAWLETLPDGAQRSDLVTSALNGFGTIDDFMALARRLPDSKKREEKIVWRLSWWAKENPEAARAWMAGQDDPALVHASAQVEGGLIVDLAATAPAAALARWQALPPGDARIESTVPLATQWARSDSPAATRWLFQQLSAADPAAPQTVNIASQLRSVAGGWIAQDPAGYFEWVQTLPAGDPRERAIETLANSSPYSLSREGNLIEPPPRAAYAEKLAQLKNPAVRERALNTHLAAWLRSDLHTARAWIESSDALSPDAAARLLTQAAPR